MIEFPPQHFTYLWHRLTNPRPEIAEPDRRRQSRMLAALLLVLTPLVMLLNVVGGLTMVPADSLLHARGFGIGLLVTLLLAGAYGLSRSRYYSLAAGFTVISMSAGVFMIAGYRSPPRPDLLALLVVPLLLGSMFLRFQTTLKVVFFQLAGLLLFPVIVPTVPLNQIVTGPFVYTVLVSVLILMVTYHRNLLEDDRSRDLAELVDARTRDLMRANQELEVEVRVRQWAQEALLQSEARNWAMLDALPDPMLRVATDGTIRDFKPAAARSPLQSALPEELVGKSVYDVFSAELSQQFITSVRQAIAAGSAVVLEHRFGGKVDGEIRIVASGSDEALCIVRDITERKQVEDGLRRALEKEKQLGEMKMRFFSMVSHEFRSPLTAILSSSELLRHYYERMSDERKLKHHQTIESQVKRLTELLDDVMLLSKAEGGKLEFNPAPLALDELCIEIVEEMQLSAAATHQIVFTYSGEAGPAAMDKKLLRYILTNLLSNAVKYSPQGGVVRLDITCERGQATFRVQDSGIGIPEEDQAQLFQVFYRASNVDGLPGTGLGLAITRRAVELHQGTIALESRVGAGTTFTVTLPLGAPAISDDEPARPAVAV